MTAEARCAAVHPRTGRQCTLKDTRGDHGLLHHMAPDPDSRKMGESWPVSVEALRRWAERRP